MIIVDLNDISFGIDATIPKVMDCLVGEEDDPYAVGDTTFEDTDTKFGCQFHCSEMIALNQKSMSKIVVIEL